MAAALVERLAPYAERGVPIVGCEPSCVLTLRDEYLDLLPDDPRVRAVADQVHLVPELLVRAIDDGDLRLDPASAAGGTTDRAARSLPREGGHRDPSHARAAAAHPWSHASRRSTPGCCGMAGSFGFESEHYELSMQIGALAAVSQPGGRGR